MYERFTDRARRVMQLANEEAIRFNHEYVGTEAILLGLVREGSGVAANALKNLEIDLHRIRLQVEKIILSGPDTVISSKRPQTPRAKKVIEYAISEARNLNHDYVGTEHLLLGLLLEEEGVASLVLQNLGLNADIIRQEVFLLLGNNRPSPVPSPLVIPQKDTSDLPAQVRQELDELNARIEQFNRRKELAVEATAFEWAASLRDQADKLFKRRQSLLAEWQLQYTIDPSWLSWNDGTVAKIARVIAAERRWDDLPILADALEEAGCTNREMLNHCRDSQPHGAYCWVVNLLCSLTSTRSKP